MRALVAFVAIASLPFLSPTPSLGQTPAPADDSAAVPQSAARGSALELERFNRHLIPLRKAPAASIDKLPQGGELSESLDPKERPALKFLRQGKTLTGSVQKGKGKGGFGPASAGGASGSGASGSEASSLPQHQNKLEDPLIRNPGDFLVEYVLEADAEVSVAVLASDGMPVRRFDFPAGTPGGRAGLNRVICWDGQDDAGREAPAGEYQAIQSIRYGGAQDGRAETRLLRLRK